MTTVLQSTPTIPTPSSIHKRGHSASAISFRISNSKKNDQDMTHPPSPTSAGHSINLKPYLRKLSLKDNQNVVDLSRSYAENQSIAGLAFYDESRSGSDLAFSPTQGHSRHARSTSNNSNFSVASTSQRPTVPYAFPMRHTPRPYTPPIARSYTANSSNSEASAEADDIMSVEDFRSRQRAFDPSRRSGSIGSIPVVPQPYHSYSNNSLTRLNNISQSSLPTSRSRGGTMQSIDTVPSSRASMERAMTFLRSTSKEESSDPATRAATIQAARIAYAEREEAKERKAEKDYLKAQDKADRRKRHREEKTRRQSESNATPTTTATSITNEKFSFIGRAYDDYEPVHSQSLPAHVTTASTVAAAPDLRTSRTPKKANRSTLRSRWLGFLAWFRTRLLRMKKKSPKPHKSSSSITT